MGRRLCRSPGRRTGAPQASSRSGSGRGGRFLAWRASECGCECGAAGHGRAAGRCGSRRRRDGLACKRPTACAKAAAAGRAVQWSGSGQADLWAGSRRTDGRARARGGERRHWHCHQCTAWCGRPTDPRAHPTGLAGEPVGGVGCGVWGAGSLPSAGGRVQVQQQQQDQARRGGRRGSDSGRRQQHCAGRGWSHCVSSTRSGTLKGLVRLEERARLLPAGRLT